MELLKKTPVERAPDLFIRDATDDDEAFERIRCPLCDWTPSRSSRWFCSGAGTPEPAFDSCGTAWNTFTTRGLCPGCQHQWQWTSCLRCSGWSLHEDWYEDGERRS